MLIGHLCMPQIFIVLRAMLVNQNYIVYINMKQDADTLKKTQVGAVRC